MSLFEIDSIQKRLGERLILSDISLKVESGDIVGVFGRNGVGKSTLMQILFGTVEAENKFLRIDGKVVEFPYTTKNNINYLPQFDFVPKHLTVREAIRLIITKRNQSALLQDESIQNYLEVKVSNLSQGIKRLILIKIFLFQDTKFTLLDEPYAGLSPIVCEQINRDIVTASTRKGIIITDHNYNYLLEVANRILYLKQGKLIELTDKAALNALGYLPS